MNPNWAPSDSPIHTQPGPRGSRADGVTALPDGGHAAKGGIAPRDHEQLAGFLDEYQDVAGYEIRLTDPAPKRPVLLHDATIDERTLERPSAAPSLRCTPVDPSVDTFSVPVAAIHTISSCVPPPAAYTESAETAAELAVGLRRLASVDPAAVDVPALVGILQGEETRARRDALRALRQLATVRPMDCRAAIPVIRSDIEGSDRHIRANALATLRAIGDDDPSAIAPLVEEIHPALDATDSTVRREGARCIAAIAEEFPGDVTETIPALATILEDGAAGQTHAIYTLSRISTANPDAVRPVIDLLGEAIRDRTLSATTRVNATAALGRLVGEDPRVGLDVVGPVATLVDDDHPQLRNNAIALLGDVATVHTDVVEPHTPAIADGLTVDDSYTRVNASAALSRVAEDFPSAVAPYGETLESLLTDDHAQVRENACWALGYLRAEDSTDVLADRARHDENADVRKTANWALDRIQE